MTGPLSVVLAAFRSGAGTLVEVQQATGLDAGVVRAAVDHLIRLRRLEARDLLLGCPTSGCGACPVAKLAPGGCSTAAETRPGALRTLILAGPDGS